MTNRKQRRARRRTMTPAERFNADRYRPHRNMTSAEVRQVLVDDGVARRLTPLTWFIQGVTYIALKDKLPRDTVYTQIDETVRERCGMGLPQPGFVG